jgi:hypothetical protein
MKRHPEKHQNLMQLIKACVESGDYRDTTHAKDRKGGRNILRTEIEFVLKNGHHVPRKDQFDELFQAWNYAIEGSTVDRRKLRIIVSFNDVTKMLIITVIDLGK